MISSMSEYPDKARENRLRRMASRQGLQLIKSRRRDRRALDYGGYWLASPYSGGLVADHVLTLDDVEAYLLRD